MLQEQPINDLKLKTICAGIANIGGRTVSIVIRVGSIMILGRLLSPRDYGLVGMVAAFTGVLNMVGGFGLFQAAVQIETMTAENTSTLFWLNAILGTVLTIVTWGFAPVLSWFYHETQLFLITIAMGFSFLFAGAGVQHSALLQRQMRFGALALIDIISMSIGTCMATGVAMAGGKYWALVAMTVCCPLVTTIGLWVAAGWIPGRPGNWNGIRSLVRFGGMTTLSGLIAYLSYNSGKMLLGRFFGAEALGIYDRAYNLIVVPIDILNSTIGEVAFSALSRTRTRLNRFRSFFLQGYSLVVTLTVPITIFGALFADDIVVIMLGGRWMESVDIFRILAPTILAFAIANPLGWLINSLGMVSRGLGIALASAPVVVIAFVIGLPYSAKGIAVAYSVVMMLKVIPVTVWAIKGTVIRLSDIGNALRLPFSASFVSAFGAYKMQLLYGADLSASLRLVLDIAVFSILYFSLLALSAEYRTFYRLLFRLLKGRRLADVV